jgi:hypothetical protein
MSSFNKNNFAHFEKRRILSRFLKEKIQEILSH